MVKKQDLIEEAKALGLDVDAKGKLAEIEEAIEVAKAGLSDKQVEEKLTEAKEERDKGKKKKPATDEEQLEDSENSEEETAPEDVEEAQVEEEQPLAKAGKRSAKAVKEAEEEKAKAERKTKPEEDAEKPKRPQPKARPRIERRGKKYRDAAKQIDKTKDYSPDEAVALAQKTSPVAFDASLELHVNLGVDPRQSDQNIRGTVVLPHGSGKTLRIAVFGSDEEVKAAKAAGADIAAADEFLEQLKKEELNFDVLIATPATMPKLGQFAKLLGPKGLMPNPKSGTVSTNVTQAVKEAKAGKVEFRVDKQSILHARFGKVSFDTKGLVANLQALLKAIQDARPASVKGVYIKKVTVTTTMGPSIKLDLKSL